MELTNLLLTGSLSGLVSVLAHAVLWSAVETLRGPVTAAALQVSDALLHMACGIVLALLFWLSWGLAAVVDVPWWVRGVSFGSLCWLALALPSLASLALNRALSAAAALIAASRWATTCLIAGLACAWTWAGRL